MKRLSKTKVNLTTGLRRPRHRLLVITAIGLVGLLTLAIPGRGILTANAGPGGVEPTFKGELNNNDFLDLSRTLHNQARGEILIWPNTKDNTSGHINVSVWGLPEIYEDSDLDNERSYYEVVVQIGEDKVSSGDVCEYREAKHLDNGSQLICSFQPDGLPSAFPYSEEPVTVKVELLYQNIYRIRENPGHAYDTINVASTEIISNLPNPTPNFNGAFDPATVDPKFTIVNTGDPANRFSSEIKIWPDDAGASGSRSYYPAGRIFVKVAGLEQLPDGGLYNLLFEVQDSIDTFSIGAPLQLVDSASGTYQADSNTLISPRDVVIKKVTLRKYTRVKSDQPNDSKTKVFEAFADITSRDLDVKV